MGIISRMKANKTGAVLVDIFDWYPSHLPQEERKLLRKLDCAIMIFACLSFFCKFLDQSNITAAYVTGMKEDIGAEGNALNYFNVAYYTAYVVGQVPLMYFQTKPKLAAHFLPTMEIFWAIITFAQVRVTKVWHVCLCRALLGFFGAPSFGATHLIFGSWYRKEEIFKRAGVWFTGNFVGSMFSGYLQAAAYNNLDGTNGLSGWQWLFLINGIITAPISFIGYALFPGLPNSPKRWWMSDSDYELARSRLPAEHKHDEGISWKTIKQSLSRPMFWICVPAFVFWVQSVYWTNYMALWLKDDPKYNETQINIYPTFVYVTAALSSWLGSTIAGTANLYVLWSIPSMTMMFASICLAVWYIPDPLKFIAFYLGGTGNMASPILFSWLNTTLAYSTAERGFVISSMMCIGYCFWIWLPLFTFPTVEAPRFPHGYAPTAAFSFCSWVIILFGIWYMRRRERPVGDAEATIRHNMGDEGYEERAEKKVEEVRLEDVQVMALGGEMRASAVHT